MKTLTKYIEEKLIINKNYKNIDGLEELLELFNNIDFKYNYNNTLQTSEDIFSIMVDYIRDHNIRSLSDFDSYRNKARENNNACLAVFNKRIKEIDIFQKISNNNYTVYIIYRRYSDLYMFNKYERRSTSMHCLNKGNTWANVNDVEYYEISEKTFDDISELYNELIKK